MPRAKKSLGQNFLISPRVAERMADANDSHLGMRVLEIGPGKGILTGALLRSGAHVIAVEKDDSLVPLLREKFAPEISSGCLELIHGDILDVLLSRELKIEDYHVVANIPYYITGEILRNLLSAKNKPRAMILMVQKEVADRILDTKESILSVSVKIYGTPSRVMNVSRGNFFPAPNVDSAVIKIDAIRDPFENEEEEKRFFEVLKAGFAHKRKLLRSNLKKVASQEEIEKVFDMLKIDTSVRPEDVESRTWFELARKIS